MWQWLPFLALIFVSPAWAAAPAICGAIDTALETGGSAAGAYGSCPANYHNSALGSGHGCAADCDAPDQDNDDYTSNGSPSVILGSTAIDCDDKNPLIYPGVWTATGCNTGFAHYCDTDGLYKDAPGGATTVLNGGAGCTAASGVSQATGTGVRRFVDCGNSLGSASDANPGPQDLFRS
jgi:hypothetical protein